MHAVRYSFLNKVNDCGLHQTNDLPTKSDAILDIFLTNRPGLVTKTTIIPGLGDYGIVLTDSCIKAAKHRLHT